MDYLNTYIDSLLSDDLRKDQVAQQFITTFTEEFPHNQIQSIPLSRFIIAPRGTGYDDTFCQRTMHSPLTSMGRCRPDIFGIYLKGGNSLTLSKTFQNRFGNDYDAAFAEIKTQMANLLNSARSDDFDAINDNLLNSAFKNILLSIYYPIKYLPAPTLTALNAYCDALNIATDRKISMPVRNRALVEWKQSMSVCQDWSNFVLMRFCDWLWRSGTSIDGNAFQRRPVYEDVLSIIGEIDALPIEGKTKDTVVKVRINQGVFRDLLLGRYGRCCICGMTNPQLLTASHIKPWAASGPDERLDPDNGFLLCPNHDKLFDQGFISFDDDGRIMISKLLNNAERVLMNVSSDIKIQLTEQNKKYLAYHRVHVFK